MIEMKSNGNSGGDGGRGLKSAVTSSMKPSRHLGH
jgi:hypothetical protein